jgi:FAD/FMN-containing dehydrogenase
MDLARHLGRVLSVDPEAATATVEPGAVLDDLQAATRPHRLRFGTDPSTHSRGRAASRLSAAAWKFVGGQGLAGRGCSCQALGWAR